MGNLTKYKTTHFEIMLQFFIEYIRFDWGGNEVALDSAQK